MMVENKNTLTLQTSPGAIWWTKEPDGSFSYKSGALGGGGSGKNSAEEVAKRISSCAGPNMPTLVADLRKLGWQDVIDELTKLEREKKAKQIEGLKHQVAALRQNAKDNEGKNYWHFRKVAYDNLRGPNGEEPNEEDVSVQRLHQAACAMMDSPELVERIEKEIVRLEATIDDPL